MTGMRGPGSEEDLSVASVRVASGPLILPYAGVLPALASDPRVCGDRVTLIGRTTIGRDPVLGSGAVVRADGNFVTIGDDFALGEMSTVHIAGDRYPTVVGDGVSVGRNAVVHACTVGDGCVLGDDVVVLDGSVLGEGVLVEPGSTVYPRSVLEAWTVYAGSPARPVRGLDAVERDRQSDEIRRAIAAGGDASDGSGGPAVAAGAGVFVAATARLAGRVEVGEGASVFFGCRVAAAPGASIVIGAGSNVQDNTVLDVPDGRLVIGPDTTVGHNVAIGAATIGRRSLVGIGCRLAAGTVVEDDVLVAAGAVTESGQRLAAGWLWGGRPARRLSPLDPARREMMAATVEHYRAYGAAYDRAQRDAGR